MRSYSRSLTHLILLAVFLFASPVRAVTIVYVGDKPVNLRTGPGVNNSILAEVPSGEALTVIGQSGVWLNVNRSNGQSGWVNGAFVVSSPPSSAAASSPGVVAVNTGKLNLRSGPGAAFPVVAELIQDEQLIVIARSGIWINVQRLNGQTGWVNGSLVKTVAGAAASAPQPASPAPTSPGPTSSTSTSSAVVNSPFLNLRSGPGALFPSLAEMPQGEVLAVLSKSGLWVSVRRSSGQEGWANGSLLKITGTAPVSSSSSSTGAFCRSGDVLAGVYRPSRLTMLNPCLSVTGQVVELSRSDDGDMTFRLKVDSAFGWVLNNDNRAQIRGYLQVEIIPDDQDTVTTPALAARVTVTGSFVTDTDHGWNEIHPVWFIASAP